MSKILIDLMWEKFEAHQPFADELGYGPEWKAMCEQRTEDAAETAADAAEDAVEYADACAECAAYAADAASVAVAVLDNAAVAEHWAEQAIEFINKAEGKS